MLRESKSSERTFSLRGCEKPDGSGFVNVNRGGSNPTVVLSRDSIDNIRAEHPHVVCALTLQESPAWSMGVFDIINAVTLLIYARPVTTVVQDETSFCAIY